MVRQNNHGSIFIKGLRKMSTESPQTILYHVKPLTMIGNFFCAWWW